jgi:septum formation protein
MLASVGVAKSRTCLRFPFCFPDPFVPLTAICLYRSEFGRVLLFSRTNKSGADCCNRRSVLHTQESDPARSLLAAMRPAKAATRTMTSMLVLASASPRRQELLHNARIAFEVQPAHIDEDFLPDEPAQACAERLAREKALAIARLRPNDTILGADTVVVIDNQILGKPGDASDAARMLRMLSGRKHRVITGVCVVSSRLASGGEVAAASEATVVEMSEITEEEISSYIATGEPMDKAGAYAIQGIASRWIPRIEGDYSNVVGLPVARVYRMLQERHLL